MNPHSLDMFKMPISYLIFRKRPLKKYEYFFDTFIKKGGRLCFDFSETSFSRISKIWFLLVPFIFVEILIWLHINGISLSKVSFFPKRSFNIVVFTYKGATEKNFLKKAVLERANKIYWHFSHYFIRTSEKAAFIFKFKEKSVVMADVDIRENKFFRHHFNFLEGAPLSLIPFVPANRFKINDNLKHRESSIIYASGTYHDTKNSRENYDSNKFFKTNTNHFLRKEISESSLNWIENGLSDFQEQSGVGTSTYFDNDLVKIFNHFSLVVCGDELCGLPAISNFEAMACGAIPIIYPENYKGLNLKPGVHFYEHKGELEDLSQYLGIDNDKFRQHIKERGMIKKMLIDIVDDSVKSLFND